MSVYACFLSLQVCDQHDHNIWFSTLTSRLDVISGKVYRGILQNNQHVAVKHIINDNHMETFVREIASLSHIKHPNLVALLGYCEVEDECFLVYELCPDGNLSEWLFGIPFSYYEVILSV